VNSAVEHGTVRFDGARRPCTALGVTHNRPRVNPGAAKRAQLNGTGLISVSITVGLALFRTTARSAALGVRP